MKKDAYDKLTSKKEVKDTISKKSKIKDSVVKEYYEAESWQFSWCWD